jgi:hypothetical protein
VLEIELPTEFNASHERAVIDYLSNRLSGRKAWVQAFAAFDILDQAVLVTENERTTFRQLYQLVVDRVLADTYIDELLVLDNVAQESPALWARFARQIVQEVVQRGWRRPDVPATRRSAAGARLLHCSPICRRTHVHARCDASTARLGADQRRYRRG